MFQKRIPKVTLCCLLLIHIEASGYTGYASSKASSTPVPLWLRIPGDAFRFRPDHQLPSGEHSQDQTSSRTNTLLDDADDIQRQLDNEARDRIKLGRPKTIWVFHFPTHYPEPNAIVETTDEHKRCPRHLTIEEAEEEEEGQGSPGGAALEDWDYETQGNWSKKFPECGEQSQSPVDLPVAGLIKPRGARPLMFQNHAVPAKTMTLMMDGKQMMLFGEWRNEQRPLIYGGAAHSRRYLFHSMVVHLPAEHTVGSMYYPLETQFFYVSAEYKDMDHALDSASSDPQAILAVSNLYSYANDTHRGLMDILIAANKQESRKGPMKGNCLSYFNPTFKEYACYQGSLTTPPCTQSVLWLIRGRTLHITRATWEAAQKIISDNADEKQANFRITQPLNDRKVFFFK